MLYHISPIILEHEKTMLHALAYIVDTYGYAQERATIELLVDGYATIREVKK